MPLTEQVFDQASRKIRDRQVVGVQDRVRVDGKFLVRGNQRLRIQGVTYGPFPPNEDAEPFPRRAA